MTDRYGVSGEAYREKVLAQTTPPDGLRRDITDPADYERCRALAPYTDKPGAVAVRGRRGTLIDAKITVRGFPPGCRIVFDDERETLRKSKTRKEPDGLPVSRNFRSEEVTIVG